MSTFFLLVILLLGSDGVRPVAVVPFETKAECEAVLSGDDWLDAKAQLSEGQPFVAECVPVQRAPKPDAPKQRM